MILTHTNTLVVRLCGNQQQQQHTTGRLAVFSLSRTEQKRTPESNKDREIDRCGERQQAVAASLDQEAAAADGNDQKKKKKRRR